MSVAFYWAILIVYWSYMMQLVWQEGPRQLIPMHAWHDVGEGWKLRFTYPNQPCILRGSPHSLLAGYSYFLHSELGILETILQVSNPFKV